MPDLYYFDCNATTQMGAAAREAWLEASDRHWANPSSLYREAGLAKQELDRWREELADRLGVEEPERIVFTSGATEANNAVIRYFLDTGRKRIAYSAIEHPCVDAAVKQWGDSEQVREIPVHSDTGVVDLAPLRDWIGDGEIDAVSVMAANNETGALQPWREVAALCREQGIPFHSDAAQWIGKMESGDFDGVDWITGSAHKFEGGKGCGFLVISEEELDRFHGLIGGPQEDGRRAGTENLPAVAGMVTALMGRSDEDLSDIAGVQSQRRDHFEAQVRDALGVRLLGDGGARLWNTSMFVLPHTRNAKWVSRLSQRGFAVSTGSACSAGRGNPSRVMAAMGLDYDEMGRVLRISGEWETPAAHWEALAGALVEIEKELQGQ